LWHSIDGGEDGGLDIVPGSSALRILSPGSAGFVY